MFAYEIYMIDGSVWCCEGFQNRYEAEVAMYDFIDELNFPVDYVIVMEVR